MVWFSMFLCGGGENGKFSVYINEIGLRHIDSGEICDDCQSKTMSSFIGLENLFGMLEISFRFPSIFSG